MQQEHVTATTRTGNEPRYRPISQYGIIGDCRTAALIGPDGSVDWCCLPHFDSPAVFCRLLDASRGGYFRIGPQEAAQSSMTYLPGTNILETIFQGSAGRLRLVDFMPIRKRQPRLGWGERLNTLLRERAPHSITAEIERDLGNDVAAAHRINRIASCLEGHVEVELTLKATFEYARQEAEIQPKISQDGVYGAILSKGERHLVLLVKRLHTLVTTRDGTELTLVPDGELLRLHTTLHAGQGLIAVLNYARDAAEAERILGELSTHDFNADLEETHEYWRGWSAACRYSGSYETAVTRSALTLKLCTFEPTGAIVAAPTTSLPESIGGVRNWDYRYTWLRDSSFTLAALERLGYYDEARDYFHFLHNLQIKCGDDLRIMYGIRGETGSQLAEHELTHLEGYRGSHPVRIGNGAAEQHQLDIYGEVLDGAYSYLSHQGYHHESALRGPIHDLRDLSSLIADYVVQHWRDEDRGIWEVRGDPRPFVYSRAMCWAAVDRACRMAEHHGHHAHVQKWAACAAQIHADVLQHGYDVELGSFTQAYGSSVFDAANLRIPLVGFLPWADPRVASSMDATARALAAPHALIYRYKTASGAAASDGLPGTEGTFIACAFWLIDNLCYLGRIEEARLRFEEVLRCAGPLGLFAEELDAGTGEQLGNYPQAFTHIGLVNSAVTLQMAQEGTLIPR
ncbi:MAG TPA: glycoside hydrolase family 15 protein [Ktedonobacterales bacterium]|nr:glycoside hydrolase family 15 protein [Ktedonobacterales bacterium]